MIGIQSNRRNRLEKEYFKLIADNNISANNIDLYNSMSESDFYNFIYESSTSRRLPVENLDLSSRNESKSELPKVLLSKTSDRDEDLDKIKKLSKLNVSARYELIKANNLILDFLLVF